MSKKNYKVPGHGTKIKHPVVENPSLAKGSNPVDKPGDSPAVEKAERRKGIKT